MTESLMGNMPVIAAAFIIILIILVGVIFDVIGIAFTSCDVRPFISMASRKIKRAKSAIRLLKNADIVSNICGDVVGDICGIVSGAAGVTVAVKAALYADASEMVWVILFSSLIAALTVAGKAAGKKLGLKKNKEIVSFVSSAVMVFARDGKNNGADNSKKV